MARVSVVMPAHNAARTIGRSIESLLRQTYPDWELIVCDDASTDQTRETAMSYADPRVHLTVRGDKGGPARARNDALGRATGELIAFLDADDWWREDFLAWQTAAYDRATRDGHSIGILACDALLAKPDGTPTSTSYRHQLGRFARLPPTLDTLLLRNSIFIAAVVPRAIGESIGWFDATLFVSEDWDLWLRILERGHELLVEPEPLAVYRRTDASISLDLPRQAEYNALVLRAALSRGRLTPGQQRRARQQLRYNQALGAVASALRTRKVPAAAELLNAGRVALTSPRHWPDWVRAVRAR